MAFETELKFRCPQTFADRVDGLAAMAKRKRSDWLRLAMEEYVEREEKRLGLTSSAQSTSRVEAHTASPIVSKRRGNRT